jgi:hypothetical protein
MDSNPIKMFPVVWKFSVIEEQHKDQRFCLAPKIAKAKATTPEILSWVPIPVMVFYLARKVGRVDEQCHGKITGTKPRPLKMCNGFGSRRRLLDLCNEARQNNGAKNKTVCFGMESTITNTTTLKDQPGPKYRSESTFL